MQTNEFTCSSCGAVHEYTLYLKTVLKDRPRHACSNCGAVHILSEGEPLLVEPGQALTEWYGPDQEPVMDGFYQLLFPNGNAPEHNWWWNRRTSLFHYEEHSTVSIAMSSIKGWRGVRDSSVPAYIEVPV